MNRRVRIMDAVLSGVNTSPKIAEYLNVPRKDVQNDLYHIEKDGYIRCTHTIKVPTGNAIKVYTRTDKQYIDPNKRRGRTPGSCETETGFSTCETLESFMHVYGSMHGPIPAMTGL